MVRKFFYNPNKNPSSFTEPEKDLREFPPDDNGVVTAMAKGVNDLLNYYIHVADAKASVMIAGTVASASFLLKAFPDNCVAQSVYLLAASCLGVSLVFAIWVVLPRLPSINGKGCVFWGDIATCVSAAEYRNRFASTVTAGLLDDDYCILNFRTATILHSKMRFVRRAILFYLGGVLLAVPHHLIHS